MWCKGYGSGKFLDGMRESECYGGIFSRPKLARVVGDVG